MKKKPAYSFLIVCGMFVTFSILASSTSDDLQSYQSSSQEKQNDNIHSWESEMAIATKEGDLQWKPEPFTFDAGKVIRYIDFEKGNDNNSGKNKNSAWKHHPWDLNSSGKSKESKGADTYIFKNGSIYRGTITIKRSGEPDNPIRFTSDPSWGKGQAAFFGSLNVTGGWTKGTNHPDIPEKELVWYKDLDFAPRTLWMVECESIKRIPMARTPNWKISDPEDIKSEWWHWDYKGSDRYFNVFMKNEQGKELVLGIDSKNINREKDYYMGALAWTEFGWVDGTPYPSYVQGFDGEKKGIGFEGYLGSANSRIISRNHRYYLEDKPHYLDDSEGEYWFEKKGEGGRLYLILPDEKNPNKVSLEAGKVTTILDAEDKSHLVFSGLSFKFTNVPWDLTELPWGAKFELKKHLYPASIRIWGGGNNITVRNCSFEHVNSAVYIKASNPDSYADNISVKDCYINETDYTAISIEDGFEWGFVLPDDGGHLYDVKVLRNYISKAGQRPQRVGSGDGINIHCGQTVEIAGNIIETPWHAGINVFGGKLNGHISDAPLTRILIYQNKVTDGIRTGDDCGNIETWQGGAAYIYNNLSGNPGGFRNPQWNDGKSNPNNPGSARFGMAYYLDGAFKNYYFNNIGWGLSSDPWSKVAATTMFQEIISYQNAFFNNTAYNFVKGTRRQAPHAGSNKFLGNIWDRIGDWVFWHTTPARSQLEGNERDAGTPQQHYALETNAFENNIFHDITGKIAAFKPSGQWHISFEEARSALIETDAIASGLGYVADKPIMKDPDNKDFSLTENSTAIDRGTNVFVPWSLYAPVGEWHFYPAGDDPTNIIDEHWYMTEYYVNRDNYFKNPMFHLKGVNITEDDYTSGPLEDWTNGALSFNGVNQYAFCHDSLLSQSFDYKFRYLWDKGDNEPTTRHITGKDFKSPQVYDSNFLIEVYFKTAKNFTSGLIAQKMSSSGYSLQVNDKGGVTFTNKSGNKETNINSKCRINDGEWHHVVVEADRDNEFLNIYIDGKFDNKNVGFNKSLSLENDENLYVGGSPEGEFFQGTMDFLRICLGTLSDSKTSITELYKWQFDGPFLRDFTGNLPVGKRDAGALEKK